MLQPKFQSAPHKVDHQRPLEIAVTVSTHNDDGRSDCPQFVKNRFCANIAKVPDFIGILGHFLHTFRQTIVRIRQNENASRFVGFPLGTHLIL
jgi:hypothetical protein